MRQEEVENITLKAIANELFISSSTVIRACKKLGYQTYNELRYDLRLSKELKKNQAKLEHNSFEQLKEQLHVEFEHTLSILSEQDFQSFFEENQKKLNAYIENRQTLDAYKDKASID